MSQRTDVIANLTCVDLQIIYAIPLALVYTSSQTQLTSLIPRARRTKLVVHYKKLWKQAYLIPAKETHIPTVLQMTIQYWEHIFLNV